MAQNNENATTTVTVNGEEAKRELTALAQRAETLRQKLKEANDAGDEKAFSKLGKQLKATQKEMKQLERDSFDLKKVLNNLSGASIGELTRAKRELDKQFGSPALQRNSKEWKQVRDDLRSVKKEISSLNSETAVGESGMSKFANGFNKYFAGITAFIAGLTGITLGLKKFMDLRNEVEDSKANLAALTGLGDDDIQWLRDYAKELSTTTTEAGVRITASAKEIMDGFTTIGSKRPELLKNKEAMASVTKEALTLAAAGKMDVATAFDVVTASMNQFNLGAAESGRIINVIAAGSLEGSAEADSLAGSLKNVGTVADGSNLSLEDTIALLEVLASKQLLGEEAGTKLRGAILRMKDAQFGYTSGAFNMRDALVELNAELDKKTNAAEKDALMQKIFGAENITVGDILIKNVDSYDKLRVAVTGTNTAYAQAVIQTSTVSARMAQAKNEFNEAGMALVENLNPAVLKITSFSTNFLKVLVQLPKWLSENKGLLLTLTLAMGAYTLAIAYNTIAKKANELATKALDSATIKFFKTLVTNPYVAVGVVIAAVTVGIYKLITAQTAAQTALADFNKQAYEQQRELNNLFEAYKKANPQTAEKARLLAIIKEKYGPYIQSLIDEKGNITDIEKAQKLANTALRQSIALKVQNASIDKIATEEIEKQTDILSDIQNFVAKKKGNDIAGVVVSEIGRIFNENSTDLKKAYSQAWDMLSKYGLSPLSKKGMFSGMLADDLRGLWNSFARISNQTNSIKSVFKGLIGDVETIATVDPVINTTTNTTTNSNGDLSDKDKDKAFKKAEEGLEASGKRRQIIIDDMYQNLNMSQYLYEQMSLNNTIETLLEKEKLYKKYGKETADIEKQISDNRVKQFELEKKRIEYWDKAADELKKIDIPTPEESIDESTMATLIQGKLVAPYEYGLALRLKILDRWHKNSVISEEEYLTNLSDLYKGNQDEINKYLKDKNLQENEQKFRVGLIGEKEYIEKNREIYAEYIENKFAKEKQLAEDITQIANAAADFSAALQDAALQKIDNKYAQELQAAKKAGKDTTELEERIENEKKEVRKKYADVDFGIKVAQIIASTAAGIMNIWAQTGVNPVLAAALSAILGGVGLAQLAVANEQRQAIKGYYDGGYTGGNDPREVRGHFPDGSPYHGMEYVADHRTTGNQAFRKVFDLAEYAKKTNRIASITTSDIANALGMKAGYYAGGYKPADYAAGSSTPDTYSNSELTAALRESNAVNAALLAEIQRGITSKTYIHGDGGIEKAQETYDKLIKNARG